MVSEELKAIIDKYNKSETNRFICGATEEQISVFETEHMITLPAKYKDWLQFSDGGEWFPPAGIQLYGVAHKPVIYIDKLNLPNETYIVIGALSTGDPIICKTEEERISIYNHDAGRIEPDETYPDFHAFINDLNGILGIGG